MQGISNRPFGTTPDGKEVTAFSLINQHGFEMEVITYGCAITSLKVPDRNGVLENIVLGFDQLDGYVFTNQHIGSIAGRYANRIAFGTFSLEEKEYTLATNNPPNHLHGGINGFVRKVFSAEEINDASGVGLTFSFLSPDGDEGYPGNLYVEVKYFFGNDNSLSFEYSATTDQSTVINLTQHSYFNLNGGKKDILDHELTIHADQFLPMDESMIPTGEFRKVKHTPFDFTQPKKVGKEINADDMQLIYANGYDHTWVVRSNGNDLNLAATLRDETSGRVMEVYTTEPGIQIYTSNFLEGDVLLRDNVPLQPRLAICLETQHFPDSPNHPSFPSVILNPNERFYSKTLLTFRCN